MNSKGFTLVELVIVTGIIVILSSFAISLYSGLALNRDLQVGSDGVLTLLNQGKSYALSQVKSSACSGSLASYSVSIATNSKCFSLYENCSAATQIRKECLSSNVSFGKNATVTFPVQNPTVTFSCSPTPCSSIIINGQLGAQKTITVDTNGIIIAQ